MDGTIRKNIQIGMLVDIVLKRDQPTGKLTRGYVKRILTSSPQHHRGIKVELTGNGDSVNRIGRVQHIPTKEEIKLENFKFYNKFFFLKKVYSIWDVVNKRYFIMDYLNPSKNNQIEKTSFLFDSQEQANLFIKGTEYDSKDYSIREVNRNKLLAESFSKIGTQFVRINKDRKLSLEKLSEWEQYFKNMR